MVVELRSAIFQGDPARIANELLEKVKNSVSEHLPIGTWWLRVTWPKETKVIKINGKSMKTWMEAVEERLNILTPNPELEAEWDDLRRLGQRYRALEQKCKEKAQMWAALKKVQPKQP